MTTTTTTQKTPSAELAGQSAEGLENPTPKEQENMTSLSASAGIPTRIALDENTVLDVEPVGESHIEVTVTSVDRSTIGIGLSIEETRRFAEALLDASAPQLGAAPIGEVEEHVRIARKNHVAMSPAKYARMMREAH